MKRRKSKKKSRRTSIITVNLKGAWRGFRESIKIVLIWIGVFAVIYLALVWR